ncbi:alkaline phosphatase family protein [Microlunatus speluncae]|uniref:alkaline phosphatase family protein n=1 Tax=Microlunatus speluncae TaxID=2594267 RepID=UPI0012664B87|nr:alkaline phosphatase family protein [Microlunatus speluncae]
MPTALTRRSVLGGAVAASLALTATPAQAAERDLLIFIGLDGFDIDYLDGRVPLPALRSLIRRGSLATSTGVMATITNQSWTAISCGAYPDRTRNAAYFYDEAAGVARGQSRDSAVEGLGQAWRRQGVLMGSAQWFILQDKGVAYGDLEGLYTQPGGRIDARVDDAIAMLSGEPVNSGGTQVTLPRRPDFLAIYSSDVDGDGHSWGPNDPRMLATLRETDAAIGRLINAVRDLRLFARTTWVVTADHGMTTWNKPLGPQVIAALTGAGFRPEVLGSGGSPTSPDTDVVLVSGGSIGSVHLFGELGADAAAVRRAEEALGAVTGIAAILTKADQAKLRMAPQYGQLVLEFEEPYALAMTPPAEGSDGRHGSRSELAIPLILSGKAIKPGAEPRAPRHIDLAATMSAILGIDPPAASEGRVLTESLR